MEETVFIKCESPGWQVDEEESLTAERSCSNEDVLKVEPDTSIVPSVKEEYPEDIKEEQGDEDDAGDSCDDGIRGKPHSEICLILPSSTNDYITTLRKSQTSVNTRDLNSHRYTHTRSITTEQLRSENHFGEDSSEDPLHVGKDLSHLCNYAGTAEEGEEVEPTLSSNEQHKCEACGKSFPNRILLLRHLFEHTDTNSFRCNLCDKVFANRTKLRYHLYIHSKQNRYICSYCGKVYSRAHEFTVHSYKHTGEKPYHCKSCDKAFSHPYILRKHMGTHAKEKEYVCIHCNKKFTVKDYLRQHMLTHLKGNLLTHTEHRPHICSLCGREFAYRSTLKRHFLKHSQ